MLYVLHVMRNIYLILRTVGMFCAGGSPYGAPRLGIQVMPIPLSDDVPRALVQAVPGVVDVVGR